MGTKAMADDAGVIRGAGEKTLGFFDRGKSFFKDVRTEMRKVTTPSSKEVRATTLVVLVTVFLFAAYFYGVDKVVGLFVDKIIQWGAAR